VRLADILEVGVDRVEGIVTRTQFELAGEPVRAEMISVVSLFRECTWRARLAVQKLNG